MPDLASQVFNLGVAMNLQRRRTLQRMADQRAFRDMQIQYAIDNAEERIEAGIALGQSSRYIAENIVRAVRATVK